MKALVDEQLSPLIASRLRESGYDVIAVTELGDLVASSDRVVLAVASAEDGAVITNNVKDFRPLAAERLAQGRTHAGLILVPSKLTRTRAAVTTLATAIETLLKDHPEGLAGSERWIGPLE
ncbi:MAG: DUF5615 family PIN-like protein [Mycobacteriales bacterium]